MIKKEYPDIKKDKLGREIIMWDPEKDILTTSAETFLTGSDTAASGAFFHWAYSLNTSMGLYRRSEEKTITVKEDIGKGFSFSYPKQLPYDLMMCLFNC